MDPASNGTGSASAAAPDSYYPLLMAHGCIHIIFWAGLMLLHFAFILYKRYITNDPFLPPHDPRFRLYMLAHHIVGAIDIGAICMAIAHALLSGDQPSALLSDSNTAATHRVAGVIILPSALFMELVPVLFGRFVNPKYNNYLTTFHKVYGKVLLSWVICFQLWSGIVIIGWDMSAMAAVYTWIGCCLVVITALFVFGRRKQQKHASDLASKFAGHGGNAAHRVISLDEVAKHASLGDVWMAINGYVIDCTDFVHHHPGGVGALMKFAGKDASKAWNMNHEKSFIAKYVGGLVVGTLEGTDPSIVDDLHAGMSRATTGTTVGFGSTTSTATADARVESGKGLNGAVADGGNAATVRFAGPRAIVVGGGLSGLSAAHAALQSGARVLILDKMAICGGNSMKATSGINGANTRIQAALGIQDNWEQFCTDTYKSAAKGAPDAHTYELAEILTRESAAAVHWLIDHFSLNLCEVGRLAGQSAPRTHRGATRFPGMMITSKLLDDIKYIAEDNSGTVEILNRARVTQLLYTVDPATNRKRVTGVEYATSAGVFREDGGVVVLATGGWAADFTRDSLLARFRPELLSFPTTNGEHCTGDGVKLAESIGAGLIGLDWVQVHPTGLVDPADPTAKVKTLAAEALRGADGLILNSQGERFCNELGRRDYVSGEMMKNKAPFYLVLNSSGYHEMKWHLDHYGSMGLFKRVASGADLARYINCEPRVLDATFKLYQSHAAYEHELVKNQPSGSDQIAAAAAAAASSASEQTGPQPPEARFWEGIAPVKDPYGKPVFKYPAAWNMTSALYVAKITPVVHYCMGGIKINAMAQVCVQGAETADFYTSDEQHGNVPIDGLYACGETTGGVHGKNRLGGSSLLDCVVFGRVAGANAAQSLEAKIGRVAMIGVQTVDTSDPDIIVEQALAAKKDQ